MTKSFSRSRRLLPRSSARKSVPSIAGSTIEIRECDMVDAVGEFAHEMPSDLVQLPRKSIEATAKAFDKVNLNVVEPKLADVLVKEKSRPNEMPKREAAESKIPSNQNSTKDEPPTVAGSGKLAMMTKAMDRMASNVDLRESLRPLGRPFVKPPYKPSAVPLIEDQRVIITHIKDHRTIFVHPHARIDEWKESSERMERLWRKCEPLKKEPEAGHIVLAAMNNEGGFARAIVMRVRAAGAEVKAQVEYMVSIINTHFFV